MTGYLLRVLIVVVAVAAALFAYRTLIPPGPPVGQGAAAEFGGVSLRLEYATTTTAREKGLGGRESLPDDYGMLFVFPEYGYYGIWMKDMLVPIDIFWLDADGHVVSIKQDVATSTYPNVFYPSAPARYVLETSAGFAEEHGVEKDPSLLLKNFKRVSE